MIKNILGFSLAIIILSLTLYSPWLILKARAQACPQNNLAEGLISAYNGITGLGNVGQVCVTGAAAYIATDEIRVDSYKDLYVQYYQQSKGSKVELPANTVLNTNSTSITSSTLFKVNGDLTINDNAFQDNPNGRVGIYFVEGNLYIPANINYGANNPLAGLVFIVKGQINIGASAVAANSTQLIRAVLVSEGITQGVVANPHSICTACAADGSVNSRYDPLNPGANTYDANLRIVGGLVSLGQNDVLFKRTPANAGVAAELIEADPRYLVLLKDLISNTIRIQREI